MPTIDQLPPAPSASDADAFIVSQGGIARKIIRSQVLNGYQKELLVHPRTLLGRTSSGVGAPEVISIGQNLSVNSGTLTASANPFVINQLPSGVVPGVADMVPVSQAGTDSAVSYRDFMSGLGGLANIDASNALVKPTGAATSQTLASLTGSLLPRSGGSLAGVLLLASDPTAPRQAATKSYVDLAAAQMVPLAGGSLAGALLLAVAPAQPLHAATKAYVDAMATGLVPVSGGSLTGVLSLKADPAAPLQASTKSYTDQRLARSGDTMTGSLGLSADPMSALQAATKNYVDTRVATALPTTGGTLTGSLLLATDPSLAAQAATKQYVDTRLFRSGDTLSGPLSLAADPAAANQAATKNYVDLQTASSVGKGGASMTGALLLASDPSLPLQAGTKQYVDLRLARAGDSMLGALALAADPTMPLQAATKQYVDVRISSVLTPAGASLTGPLLLAADPTVPLQAATKQYADKHLFRAGDTMTGALLLSADPTIALGAATKNYVDVGVAKALPVAGGSLAGALQLAADPSSAAQAATKRYVDAQLATSLPLAGGTVTGNVVVAAAPTQATHLTNKQYVDAQIVTALPITGGSLKGPLLLSAAPTLPLHATTKQYVDANPGPTGVINVAMPPYSAALNGTTDDTAAFKAAYQAAPAGGAIYVPSGVTVLQQPGAWGVALTKRVKWLIDGTTLSDGTPLASAVPTGGITAPLMLPGLAVGNTPLGFSVSQSASDPNDLAVNQSSYVVTHNGGTSRVISNQRTDTIIVSSPASFVWGGLDRLLWAGTQVPSGVSMAQHVGRYIQTLRLTAARGTSGSYLPQPELWTACLEYKDMTGQPSSSTSASITVEMDWYGNGADDANNRQIQSLVVGQANTAGAAVEVSTVIGVYLAVGSSGSVKNVFTIGIPFSGAVLDTRMATPLNSAPVIRLGAGQAIAFEGTATNRLFFDSSLSALRWNNGASQNVLGRGLSVGFQSIFSTSGLIPASAAGNICFLIGSSAMTLTLPAAVSVAAGVGYTFTNISPAAVTIVPSAGNAIDCGSVVLLPNDRYHVISDGASCWREVFRTNAVSPRWSAPPTLPVYSVASLPAGCSAGAIAYAANGRKPSEGAGAGTGVQVYFDGSRWNAVSSGSAVLS